MSIGYVSSFSELSSSIPLFFHTAGYTYLLCAYKDKYGKDSPETYAATLRWVADEPWYSTAYYHLALAYRDGLGTGVDKRLCFETLLCGVKKCREMKGKYDDSRTVELLAACYHEGVGTEKNDTLALELLRKCDSSPRVQKMIKEITGEG